MQNHSLPERMNQKPPAPGHWKQDHPILWSLIRIILAAAGVMSLFLFSLLILYLSRSTAGSAAASFLGWLLGGNPPNATWYVTRSSGLVAFLLLWLSTLYGMAVSTRILNSKLHGSYSYDFHQLLSLFALGLTAVHILILLFDGFTPFTLAQISIPFLSDYRPGWIGLGIISLYILILVTVTFYLRGRIGNRAFRLIHTLSLVGFFGAVFHGLFSGTDSGIMVVKVMYFTAAFSVVFITVYWIAASILKRNQLNSKPSRHNISARQTAD